MMNGDTLYLFAPGCTLLRHAPDIADMLYAHVGRAFPRAELRKACCRSGVAPARDAVLVFACPSCRWWYGKYYPASLAKSVMDICRENPECFSQADLREIQGAVRHLLSLRKLPAGQKTLWP